MTTHNDWRTGDRRDPVGPVSDIRSRAISGRRLTGDEFGRLFSEGDEELLYRNAEIRASALPVAPGSVLVSLSCACGYTYAGPVGAAIAERWEGIFRRVHSGAGHEVTGS